MLASEQKEAIETLMEKLSEGVKKAIFYTDKFLSLLGSHSLDFSIDLPTKNQEKRATWKD